MARVTAPLLDGRPVNVQEIQEILGVSTTREAKERFDRCREIYGTVQTGRLLQTKPPLVIPATTKGRNVLPTWMQQIAKRAMARGDIWASQEFGYTVPEIQHLVHLMTGTVVQSAKPKRKYVKAADKPNFMG